MLFFISEQGDSIVEICGGIIGVRSSGLNVVQIMRWALCVLPPVAVSIMFMEEELGACVIYTVVRAKNIRYWWCAHWLGVFAINLMYLVLFTVASALLGINRWIHGQNLALFFLVFEIHIFTMSVLSVMILFLCKSLNMSVLFFGVVEIAMVAIGSISPELSIYLFPFWGMVNYLLQAGGTYLCTIISISLGVTTLCILYTLQRLNGEKITAYARNR